jgi:hypothetical protein
VPEGLQHARRETLLAIGARGVAHHPLVLAQLLLEQERVVPDELGLHGSLERSVHGDPLFFGRERATLEV